MSDEMYSVEQVADLLDLHVRTVRGYIRAGRLRAVRIGKQYRIARADLDALTGRPESAKSPTRPTRSPVEVSSIVRIDDVDQSAADRLSTLVLAAANTGHDPARPLRVQTIHERERCHLKIVILGDAAATADLLRLVDAMFEGGSGLFARVTDPAGSIDPAREADGVREVDHA